MADTPSTSTISTDAPFGAVTETPGAPTGSAPKAAGSDDRDGRTPYRTLAILAKDRTMTTDTWQSRINNNMIGIGPSGAGKTRNILKPTLMQMGSSFIVLDTKGTLHKEVGPLLAAHGYEVQSLNFADLARESADSVGYNPLAFVRRDPVTGKPNQQDILSIADMICPVENSKDPFWDHAAANYIATYISYVLEELPESEQTLESVLKLIEAMGDGAAQTLLAELSETNPGSFARALYDRQKATEGSPATHSSVLGVLSEKIRCLGFDTALAMYDHPRQVDIARMGHEPVALFVTVSDIDHSLKPLTNLFFSQALQALMHEADRCPGGMLPFPVRFLLDDFSNLSIPNFADTLAVIRSREIWCTILVQSVAQLNSKYGPEDAASILGNCDEQLVLAFQDMQTATIFADRANKPASRLFSTPLDRAWLFVRGRGAEEVERYPIEDHPLYNEMVELAELEMRDEQDWDLWEDAVPVFDPDFDPEFSGF